MRDAVTDSKYGLRYGMFFGSYHNREREIKVLLEVIEKRSELSRCTIMCS